jgi:60 kDa SS-A/Ro ribonucleoprotein
VTGVQTCALPICLGFMAMLRNLGNFLKNKISDLHIDKVVARLKNPKAVAESKQLPFRFFSAYKFLKKNHAHDKSFEKLANALDKALELSAVNMPKLPGVTYMTADESGSMNHPISEKSEVMRVDIGNLLMATGEGFCDKAVCTVFGDRTAPVTFTKTDTILEKMDKIGKVGDTVGMSTIMSTALDYLIEKNIKVDRIIVFSDMQAYERDLSGGDCQNKVEAKLDQYRREVNADVWVHSIDLSGEGTVKTKGPKVNLIAGWSDRVFDFIALSESSGSNLLEQIENYKL